MCVGNQSKCIRYENAEGSEIGAKYNRTGEIIIVVENSRSKKEFIFYPEDDQSLFYFENILTNLIAFNNTFEENIGRKANMSQALMAFKMYNKNADLIEVTSIQNATLLAKLREVNPELKLGITIDVTFIDQKGKTSFTFSHDDKILLESFKTDLANIIKNNVQKLPPIPIANRAKEGE